MIHYHNLPKYSTEKYYLLSELEQKVNFIFIDEVLDKNLEIITNHTINKKPHLDVAYLIWKTNSDNDSMLNDLFVKINHLLANRLSEKCLLIIDWFIINEESFLNVKLHVEECFQWFTSNFCNHDLLIGISDSYISAPALDKCHDILETFVQKLPYLNHSITFYTINRDECLGYDPSHEPDADSNVYQLLCYKVNNNQNVNNNNNTIELEYELMNYLKNKYSESKIDHDNILLTKLNNNKNLTEFNYILIIFCSLCIIFFALFINAIQKDGNLFYLNLI